MKIAILSTPHLPTPPPGHGGSEMVAGLLAAGLAREGHEVVVVGHPDSRPGVPLLTVPEASRVERFDWRELAHVEADVRLTTVGRYRFEPTALEWATQRVLQALAAPIDAVLIDEIGPLELVKQAGLAPALEALLTALAGKGRKLTPDELRALMRDVDITPTITKLC